MEGELDGVRLYNFPLSDEEILSQVVQSLPSVLSRGPEQLLAHRVDRFTGVLGVIRLPGGRPIQTLEKRHRASESCEGIYFTGDYLYDATLSGACDSANTIARAVAEKVGASAQEMQVRAFDDEARAGDRSKTTVATGEIESSSGDLPFFRHLAGSEAVRPSTEG